MARQTEGSKVGKGNDTSSSIGWVMLLPAYIDFLENILIQGFIYLFIYGIILNLITTY